jgi:hypothetical protein
MSDVNIKNLGNIVNPKRGADLKLIRKPTQGTTFPHHPHSAEKISIHLRGLHPYNVVSHVPSKLQCLRDMCGFGHRKDFRE